MRMNILWTYWRQFSSKEEFFRTLTFMGKFQSGRKPGDRRMRLDQIRQISYFIATALTWR